MFRSSDSCTRIHRFEEIDVYKRQAVNPVVAVLVGKAEDKITMAVTVNKLAQEKGLKAGVLVKELDVYKRQA